MGIPKKATERIVAGLKKYQPILGDAKNRDLSESDTAVIVGDMLAEVLGYRKYEEITTELAIRGTYVDLAVRSDDGFRFLVEVKAIGSELKDIYVKQAIDYGANKGIEWVLLVNGVTWRVYKIMFRQPIEKALVIELNLLDRPARDPDVLECLGSLSREGFTKSSMTQFFQQQQAMGKFCVAAILQSEPVVSATRRELRRLYPSAKIDDEALARVIRNDVLKREVVDGDEANSARDDLKRAARALQRAKAQAAAEAAEPAPPKPPASP